MTTALTSGSTHTSTTSSREVKRNGLGQRRWSPLLLIPSSFSRRVWKIASVLVKFYWPVDTVRQVDGQTRIGIPCVSRPVLWWNTKRFWCLGSALHQEAHHGFVWCMPTATQHNTFHTQSFLLAINHWITVKNIIIFQGFNNLSNHPHRLRIRLRLSFENCISVKVFGVYWLWNTLLD